VLFPSVALTLSFFLGREEFFFVFSVRSKRINTEATEILRVLRVESCQGTKDTEKRVSVQLCRPVGKGDSCASLFR
jgi:hypothetical protein